MYILSSCRIHDYRVTVDGQTRFEHPDHSAAADDFLAAAFRSFGIDYRKFYKMDTLSRLGFLAAELLLDPTDRDRPKEDMGIVFVNSAASLEADRTYQRTIPRDADFFPSPAEFVYTLPNIVTGEIAIRHKIQGETMFYVLPASRPAQLCHLIDDTARDAGLSHVLAGRLDVDTDCLDACVMLCASTPSPAGLRLTPEALTQLFH